METATRIEIGIAVAHSSARAARAAQLPLLPLALASFTCRASS